MKRILLVEDDSDISLSIQYNLERDRRFSVTTARDGASGLRQALEQTPDLVLLDLNLPGMDGLEVCRKLRSDRATASVPIIMLTARVEESDKLTGLDLGADDYITKPFSMKELVARVKAVLRRAGGQEEDEVLSGGPIRLHLSTRKALVEEREVTLTRKEFDLLADLMRGRGRVLTREGLLERVWGYPYPGETRTVDVHVRRLRKKLGPRGGDWIETVIGVGYRFRPAG